MTRPLFDTGIFSVIDDASAIGVGWQLSFYTAGTATRINTFTTTAGSDENTNPVLSDAEGRFPAIWIDDGQTIKWVLADDVGVVIMSLDDYDIPATPPSFDPDLNDFLAGNEPLPITSGGTGESDAGNAIAALGGLPAAGGTVTDDITRSTKGVYHYWSASGMTEGIWYLTASGDPDPRGGAHGAVWLKY